MSNFTHIKVPYRAECLQLTETNADEVIAFLFREGYTAWKVSGSVYYSRPDQRTCGLPVVPVGWWIRKGEDGVIKFLPDDPVGWWIRKGEDGVIKFLPDDLFRLKYRAI